MVNQETNTVIEIDPKPKSRHRGITERSKSLLFLLREVPYITMRDIHKFFYPSNKNNAYAKEMVRVLTKNKLLHCYMLENCVCVYYLTGYGRKIVDFYLEDNPKYHIQTQSFYYAIPPHKSSEVNPFFFFPAKKLEFQNFTPHDMFRNPFKHTTYFLELYFLIRNAYRFLYVIWVDQVQNKKDSLNLTYNPDLLLTNNLSTEANRVFVELENSKIRELKLINKLNHLTVLPADWYLLICTSEEIFYNLGRLIRKIVLGTAKVNQHTVFFSTRAQAALSKNVLMGFWTPSEKGSGVYHKLKELELFRYDAEIFDKKIWMNGVGKGVYKTDVHGSKPLMEEHTVPYASRKPGTKVYKMGEIFDGYIDGFNQALDKVLLKHISIKDPFDKNGEGK